MFPSNTKTLHDGGIDSVGDDGYDNDGTRMMTITRSFDYIKDHGRISRATTTTAATESFAATFIARETNPRIHIRLIVGVSSRSWERILSTRIIRLLDVCRPSSLSLTLSSSPSLSLSLSLSQPLSALPSLRPYVLPRKTEAAYKRKRR